MRTVTLSTNKATAALSQTQRASHSATGPRRKLRRRYLSSHVTTRLSPCPEERTDGLVTSSVNNSPHCHDSRPYSPLIERCNEHLYSANGQHRPVMPPGPPTSPVPSPPHQSTLQLDLPADTIDECAAANTATESEPVKRLPNLSSALRTRLRRRRNAICAGSALGQGLKDFFASYVMSHLTDSMTSSLNLDSTAEVGSLDQSTFATGHPHLVLRSRLSCSPQTLSPFSNDTETSME